MQRYRYTCCKYLLTKFSINKWSSSASIIVTKNILTKLSINKWPSSVSIIVTKIYWQHFRSTNDLPQCQSKLYIYVGSGLGCLTPLSTIFQLSCGQSVLLVEKTGVPGENCRPVTSHWLTLSHNFVSSTPRLRGISLYRKYPPPFRWNMHYSQIITTPSDN